MIRRLYIRNQRILRLKLFPVQYNPARKAVKYFSEITVEVDFTGGEKTEGMMERDLFENVYKETILNYEVAKNWRKTREVGLKKVLQVNPFSYSDSWYKITLRDNGIYKIDGNFLANAGISLSSIDPQKIRIFSGGGKILPDSNSSPRPELRELAILFQMEGIINLTRMIIFFFTAGQLITGSTIQPRVNTNTISNPYTRDNVYWLTFTGSFPDPAKRMETRDSSLTDPSPIVSSKSKDRIHMEDDVCWESILQVILIIIINGTGKIGSFFNFLLHCSVSSLGILLLSEVKTYSSFTYSSFADSITLDATTRYSGELQRIGNNITAARFTNLTDALNTLNFYFHYSNTYLDWYEIEYSKKDSCYANQLWFENPDTSGTIEYRTSGFYGTAPYLFEIDDWFGVKKIDNFVSNADSINFKTSLLQARKNSFICWINPDSRLLFL